MEGREFGAVERGPEPLAPRAEQSLELLRQMREEMRNAEHMLGSIHDPLLKGEFSERIRLLGERMNRLDDDAHDMQRTIQVSGN